MNAAGGGVHTSDAAERGAQPRALWLWLLVVVQLAIPASYYVRGERDDERFAWRMFSAVRVQRCQVRALSVDTAGEHGPIDLERSLHSGWQRALERGRVRVIERFLLEQCAQGGRVSTQLERSCEDAVDRAAGRERFAVDCRNRKLLREPLP